MADRLVPKPRYALKVTITLLVAALATACFVPWKSLAERELTELLEAQGIRNPQLSIASIDLQGIRLERISVGTENPLVLKNLDISYSLAALWARRLNNLIFTGLAVEVTQDESGWHTSGFESGHDTGNSQSAIIAIPVAASDIAPLPFDTVKLKDSTFHISTPDWTFSAPLQLEWHKTPAAFSYAGSSLHFKNRAVELTTGTMNAELALKDGAAWAGPWKLSNIKLTGIGDDLPILAGNGTLSVFGDHVALRGLLYDAANAYRAAFTLNYLLNEPAKSVLTVTELSFPWSGGKIALHNLSVPLITGKSIHLNLEVTKIDLGGLLRQTIGAPVDATGLISGTIPVIIGTDGTVSVQQGDLHAEAPGTIIMNPDAIPGDNDQVAIVRDVLKNFHYEKLAVGADSGAGNKFALTLSLNGNNPDMYGGKPVNLNVRLTGDVLNLVQQNILAFTNPQKLLEQSKDAHH